MQYTIPYTILITILILYMCMYTYKLRNGYYPSFFYPELAMVSKSYYSQATQAFFVR